VSSEEVEHGARPANLLLATGAALLTALAILITLVLPAEYGIDLLGTGAALGLLGLADPGPVALSQSPGSAPRDDHVQYQLAPFESVEYKYRLARGAGMVYRWRATAPVTVDFHAEPDDAPEGFAESFRRGKYESGAGTYTAPFSGIHGWFWENRGMTTVMVELQSSGFFAEASEFRNGTRVDRPLVKIADNQ
jgi:hypothetical protein